MTWWLILMARSLISQKSQNFSQTNFQRCWLPLMRSPFPFRCVARDFHTIAPGSLERTCWRQFAALWGDCKKSRIAPLNAIIIIIINYSLPLATERERERERERSAQTRSASTSKVTYFLWTQVWVCMIRYEGWHLRPSGGQPLRVKSFKAAVIMGSARAWSWNLYPLQSTKDTTEDWLSLLQVHGTVEWSELQRCTHCQTSSLNHFHVEHVKLVLLSGCLHCWIDTFVAPACDFRGKKIKTMLVLF